MHIMHIMRVILFSLVSLRVYRVCHRDFRAAMISSPFRYLLEIIKFCFSFKTHGLYYISLVEVDIVN